MDAKNMTFESAMEELNSIVSKMESGEIKLAELVAFYERATALKTFLEKTLADAKLKIEKASAAPDGSVKTEPFEISAQ
jgi:exodeoxyribonuclease VII small subunit